MVNVVDGDMFSQKYDVVVCPVNLVGVMGAGLAKTFKLRYEGLEDRYKAALKCGALREGNVLFLTNEEQSLPFICLFPTKHHWKQPSTKGLVYRGLTDLAAKITNPWFPIESPRVALPAVGCGLGGLDFEWLHDQVEWLFSDCNVDLYRPQGVY